MNDNDETRKETVDRGVEDGTLSLNHYIRIKGEYLNTRSCSVELVTAVTGSVSETSYMEEVTPINVTECLISYDPDLGWVALLTIPVEVDLEASLNDQEEPNCDLNSNSNPLTFPNHPRLPFTWDKAKIESPFPGSSETESLLSEIATLGARITDLMYKRIALIEAISEIPKETIENSFSGNWAKPPSEQQNEEEKGKG